jgi:hypothetical protein
MRCLVYLFLISFLALVLVTVKTNADVTDNLLSNNFLNDWTGTNDHFHGPNILAGVHNEYREQTITLSDHLEDYEIQGVTQSQFQAEVWFWNSYSQSVDLTQEIVDSNGLEYTNTITMSGTCNSWNGCGYEDSPTNTIIINDVADDYDVTARFSFSVPSRPNHHYAADVRNPELFITYEPFAVDITTDDVEVYFEELEFTFEEDTFIFIDDYAPEPVELFDDYYTFDEDIYLLEEEFDEEITTEDVIDYIEEEFIEEEPEELEQEILEEDIIEEEKSLGEQDTETQAVTSLVSINKNGDIELSLTEQLIDSNAFALEVMIESQPMITDTVFYEPIILYPNQLNLSDNRDIYMNVTYQANDPLTTYNSNIRDNQEQRYRLRQQLDGMIWIN